MRNLLYFLIGVLLSAVACFSYAGTYPATKVWSGSWTGCESPTYCSSPSDACTKMGANYSTPVVLIPYGSGDSNYCKDATTGAQVAWAYFSPTYTCLQGGTLSGQTCTKTCTGTGEVLQADGTCKVPCTPPLISDGAGGCKDPCSSKAGQPDSYMTGQTICGKGASSPSAACYGGCVISYSFGLAMGSGSSSEWCATVGRYTGSSCTGSDSSVPTTGDDDGKINPEGEKLPQDSPEKKCVDSGQGFGSVNGVTVCVDPTTTTGKKTDTTKTTDSTGQTTTSTTTTDTKTVKNPDGSTTTITTVTNPDGSKTESTTTTSGAANGGGNGNGDGDFGWGEPGQEGELTKKDGGVNSITAVEIVSGASCPSPVLLPHGWGEIRYDLACNLADRIRPIVLAFAWLASGLIVIGGIKD